MGSEIDAAESTSGQARPRIRWPDGKSFAFTVFDDTDNATIETVGPVYDLLQDLGLLTTKSVWAIRGSGEPRIGGATCDEPDYREWALGLQAAGFEIGSHGASPGTTPREEVRRSLDRFREIFGHDPDSLANHSGCRESIYWGDARISGSSRLIYDVLTRFHMRGLFRGHIEDDPLFWGDLCQERVRYVRNFTYRDIDTLAACPVMPYHDPDRPWVRAWFASAEGRDVTTFNACVSEEAQDRLEAAGGACIMYTHFASGFVHDGQVDRRFSELMERLAARNGWFVPVSTLLDHIAGQQGIVELGPRQRGALERRWLRGKIRSGST